MGRGDSRAWDFQGLQLDIGRAHDVCRCGALELGARSCHVQHQRTTPGQWSRVQLTLGRRRRGGVARRSLGLAPDDGVAALGDGGPRHPGREHGVVLALGQEDGRPLRRGWAAGHGQEGRRQRGVAAAAAAGDDDDVGRERTAASIRSGDDDEDWRVSLGGGGGGSGQSVG